MKSDEIDSPGEVALDPAIRSFGVFLAASSSLERLLGHRIQQECGISHSMFDVLVVLSESPGGASMSHLAGEIALTSGGITRLVDRMTDSGLVTRGRSAEDGRVQIVAMTPKGEEVLIAAARVHARQVQEHFFGPLAPAEAAVMMTALDRLGRHAREALAASP